ncbi:hypothetical protein CAPTEDRAFT_173112 [Capitella teleta]|uniref:EF-hand domain-containing protein n=1 Tax=Capitella teleta TaxID=283909 RepID=R7UJK4_CAPTE|nr:hypothetical protein CAPTEDRAFT_173112 [Capitella teleta]|eukprot:ELU03948.1 hypothetical protein CAPTEDRAFT_173112 [Capitella teleta]
MTPRDFLESIKEEIPRPRAGRSTLDRRSVERYLRNTPSRAKGSTSLFRDLHDNGLVSYTEYLFLLCVLTKPRSGFQIAFNMFDTDGNQRVDKHEFLVVSVQSAFSLTTGMSATESTQTMPLKAGTNIWKMLMHAPCWPAQLLHPTLLVSITNFDDGTIGAPLGDTTLTVHFFGQRGYDVLKYEDFHRFMDNLQTEVLQLEFNEFSHGMQTISEVDFARILLRYTILTKEETDDYLERMRQRIPDSKGITFQDFKEFGQFLNNLDDFALAMRIFTFANASISESDFQRSVKAVTGHTLNKHLVHVVFQLFDVDGDGKLSHKEFISVMKDRLHRGFRSSLVPTSKWDEFKMCVKNELKQS